MQGTFRQGDVLLVTSISPEKVRRGDVIAFRRTEPDNGTRLVVHRVHSRTPEGFITQGDRISYIDRIPVHTKDLIGRVHSIQRNGREHPVRGGLAGQMRAACLRLYRRTTPILGKVYRLLRASRVMNYVWRPHIARIHLTTDKGQSVKYISGDRTVARWWPEEGRFWCQKPYDLVIDPPEECIVQAQGYSTLKESL